MMFKISPMRFFLSSKGLCHLISGKELKFKKEHKLPSNMNKRISLPMSRCKLLRKDKDLDRPNSSEEGPEISKPL